MSFDADIDTTTNEQPDNIDDDLKVDEQTKRNCLARKRIDELLEKKRLKELLDDEEDW